MYGDVYILLISLIVVCGFDHLLDLDKVHFSKQLSIDAFVTFRLDNLKDCIDECKSRKKCSAINYNRSYKLCHLLEATGSESDTNAAVKYVFGNKSEWTMQTLTSCDPCGYSEACEDLSCEIKECGIPKAINDTILLGNIYSVGSKICYSCYPGYENIETLENRCSTCMPDGNWSAVNISCACSAVPGEWMEHDGHCYLIVEELRNWTYAELQCNEKGGYLVNIENMDEEINVSSNFLDGLANSFWMGGQDKLKTGHWTWQNGRPVNYTGYTNWAPDQPEPVNKGQHCLLRSKNTYKWHDNECYHTYKSVCEKP